MEKGERTYDMIRTVSLEEISDGKLYGLNDMVKAGCDDCKGCSACCKGMGESIVLDPLDLHRLTKALELTAEQLLNSCLELHVVDGIILPNLRMQGEEEACVFLNGEGRCSIHPYRPGICRLFPLGRFYENGSFRYFLQVHECRKTNRTKVKVRRWIDTPDAVQYDRYITDWHAWLKELQQCLTQDNAKQVSMYVLQQFYLIPYVGGEGDLKAFYDSFYQRLEEARKWSGGLEAGV